MKTLELDLKKKVLIVDENDFDYYELSKNGIYFKLEKGDRYYLGWKFEFLCKGSELTEEIASELVEMEYDNFANEWFKDYKIITDDDEDDYLFLNAKPSFISAVESKGFYWLETPYGNETIFSEINNIKIVNEPLEWQRLEAEEKTFHNPLIFVKTC